MFRWVCLGVAVVFLTAVGWMINDMRLRVRQTADTVQQAGRTIHTDLPVIVERSRQTAELD